MKSLRLFLKTSLLLFISAFSVGKAAAADVDFSISTLDKILAAVPPKQEFVTIGDMMFRVEVMRDWRSRLSSYSLTGSMPQLAFGGGIQTWPGGVVPYRFASDVTPAHQEVFRDAMQEWVAFANVSFVAHSSETDFVTITNYPFGGGLSAVGKTGGEQLIQITDWTHGVMVHEIGHMLGLVHEHQRSDRDTFITVFTNNVMPGSLGNFILLPTSDNRTNYDFLSTMHYSRNAFALNPNLDTMVPKAANIQFLDVMGMNTDRVLSKSDRDGMAGKYGAPLIAPGSVVTNTADSGPGSLRTAIYYGIDHPGTTITFNIPVSDAGFNGTVFVIQPGDQMTKPGAGTVIDGTTQTGNSNPNGPEILLDGSQCEFQIDGLHLSESNCTVRGIIVNSFSGYGILLEGAAAMGNKIEGCYVGTDPSGTSAKANTLAGVAITGGANSNIVGGTSASQRNLLSGNTGSYGVLIQDAGTSGNIVEGNFIGTDVIGKNPLANSTGVRHGNGASSNIIGGVTTGARNLISGNENFGVYLADAATSGNLIEGNFIGSEVGGTNALPNGFAGVGIFGQAANNFVGAAVMGAGNLISGNANYGVVIGDAGTSGNSVQGNFIGTTSNGLAALPNNFGVLIYTGGSGNLVGGNTPGARNVISGNSPYGVYLTDPTTTGNLVQGNLIGVAADGTTARGNGSYGVFIGDGSHKNIIGLDMNGAGAGNVIANNSIGVALFDTTGQGTVNNTIRGNSIFSNGNPNGLGIDLLITNVGGANISGVTANDDGDGDSGANNLQNFPLFTVVSAGGSATTVSGTLNSAANRSFIIDVYRSPSADASGNGEGQTYAGSTSLNTDGSGNGSFTLNMFGNFTGQFFTTTATATNGDTSEFSRAIVATNGPAPPVFVGPYSKTSDGFVLHLSLQTNRNYRIQATTNLGANPVVWLDLTNFLATSSSLVFTDRTATNIPLRFYRAVTP